MFGIGDARSLCLSPQPPSGGHLKLPVSRLFLQVTNQIARCFQRILTDDPNSAISPIFCPSRVQELFLQAFQKSGQGFLSFQTKDVNMSNIILMDARWNLFESSMAKLHAANHPLPAVSDRSPDWWKTSSPVEDEPSEAFLDTFKSGVGRVQESSDAVQLLINAVFDAHRAKSRAEPTVALLDDVIEEKTGFCLSELCRRKTRGKELFGQWKESCFKSSLRRPGQLVLNPDPNLEIATDRLLLQCGTFWSGLSSALTSNAASAFRMLRKRFISMTYQDDPEPAHIGSGRARLQFTEFTNPEVVQEIVAMLRADPGNAELVASTPEMSQTNAIHSLEPVLTDERRYASAATAVTVTNASLTSSPDMGRPPVHSRKRPERVPDPGTPEGARAKRTRSDTNNVEQPSRRDDVPTQGSVPEYIPVAFPSDSEGNKFSFLSNVLCFCTRFRFFVCTLCAQPISLKKGKPYLHLRKDHSHLWPQRPVPRQQSLPCSANGLPVPEWVKSNQGVRLLGMTSFTELCLSISDRFPQPTADERQEQERMHVAVHGLFIHFAYKCKFSDCFSCSSTPNALRKHYKTHHQCNLATLPAKIGLGNIRFSTKQPEDWSIPCFCQYLQCSGSSGSRRIIVYAPTMANTPAGTQQNGDQAAVHAWNLQSGTQQNGDHAAVNAWNTCLSQHLSARLSSGALRSGALPPAFIPPDSDNDDD